jgi:hypothetical protein
MHDFFGVEDETSVGDVTLPDDEKEEGKSEVTEVI